MLILAIDTATKTGSVALFDSNPKKGLIGEITINNKLNHSDTLMTIIDSLFKVNGFKPSDIDRVAVSIGPGSFTGIRVGLGVAKGIVSATGAEIVGVNELDILAYLVSDTDKTIIPLIDARKGRNYFAKYKYSDKFMIERNSEYRDGDITALLEELDEEVIFTGDGMINNYDTIVENYGEKAFFTTMSNSYVRASILAEFASYMEADNLHTLEPYYHSKTQAEREKEKREAKASK